LFFLFFSNAFNAFPQALFFNVYRLFPPLPLEMMNIIFAVRNKKHGVVSNAILVLILITAVVVEITVLKYFM
jgi:hypothetical protein